MTTTTTLSPTELRRAIDELEAFESQQRAEQQRAELAAAQRRAEQARAETDAKLDHWKESAPIAPVLAALENVRAPVPALAAAIAQHVGMVNAMTGDAHGIRSDRLTIGPNGSWLAIDRERISTMRAEIGTEAVALCAEILHAAGEIYLENDCRARVRAGNRLPRLSTEDFSNKKETT